MKKLLLTIVSIIAVCASVFFLSSFKSVSGSQESPTPVEGYGDGHCTKCGLHNGHYRCSTFVSTKSHPSECICGHSKDSHAYR